MRTLEPTSCSPFRQLEKAGQRDNVRAYVTAYGRFYDVLRQGSGNELARQFLRTPRARITYLRTITTEESDTAYRKQTCLAAGRDSATAA